MITLLEKAKMDYKHSAGRAKESPKEAKNDTQEPQHTRGVSVSESPGVGASKDQGSLENAAILATNCRLETGKLDAGDPARLGTANVCEAKCMRSILSMAISGLMFFNRS